MVKTITIPDEVYEKLSAAKAEGESFSKLLERLVKCTNSTKALTKLRGCVEFKNKEKILAASLTAAPGKLSECAGLWSDMSGKELEEIVTRIAEMRIPVQVNNSDPHF